MTEAGSLLAERAQYATETGGLCVFCDGLLRAGERICRLADGRGWAHTVCLGNARDTANGEG